MTNDEQGTEPGSHGFLDTLLSLGRAPATAANEAGAAAAGAPLDHNDPSFTEQAGTKVAALWHKLVGEPAAATAPAYPSGPAAPVAQYTDRAGHLRGGTGAPAPAPAPMAPPTPGGGFTFPAKRPNATGQLEAEAQPPRRGTQ